VVELPIKEEPLPLTEEGRLEVELPEEE